MTGKAIELENVGFAYNGGERVLAGVDLAVERGAFLAIIGPNGGGKTTLVKILLGLLIPQEGSVSVLGGDPARRAPNVGYVPQHSDFETGFPITVKDVVLLGLKHARQHAFRRAKKYGDRAMSALKGVDMADYANRRFDTLSGGQRQRVLVARAMVSSPELLLFDEPMSNIDPQGKICLFDILSHLSESITVAMVSHDLLSATAGITEVAVVNRRLIQGREITPEMLELLYGVHDSSCPLDGYMKTLGALFENPEAGRD
jgi:zinc transport system ATP-binding protein